MNPNISLERLYYSSEQKTCFSFVTTTLRKVRLFEHYSRKSYFFVRLSFVFVLFLSVLEKRTTFSKTKTHCWRLVSEAKRLRKISLKCSAGSVISMFEKVGTDVTRLHPQGRVALRACRKESILGSHFWSKKSTNLLVKRPNFGSKSCRCVTPPNPFHNSINENLENVQIALIAAPHTHNNNNNNERTPDERRIFSSLHNRPFGQ